MTEIKHSVLAIWFCPRLYLHGYLDNPEHWKVPIMEDGYGLSIYVRMKRPYKHIKPGRQIVYACVN